LKVGIIGAHGAGKSTVFHALTGIAPASGQAEVKNRARPGQIRVQDPRLNELENIYASKKKVPVELTLLDFAPNPKEHKEGVALDSTLLPLIRDVDALLMTIPAFSGSKTGFAAALRGIDDELIFADLDQVDRRLQRLKKEKGGSDFERTQLERLFKWLEGGSPLRLLEMTAQELRTFSSFGFLSRKPALAVLNCDIESAAVSDDEQDAAATAHGIDLFRLAAAFEAELWELPAEEQAELLREAGLAAPARDRLVRALYHRLGLITFYTAGEPEAHAWPIPRGASALDAAGVIHTDIARGFIRAEVVSYDDFVKLRSDMKVKEAGKLRLEGKDYTMQDGDIIHIRFKV
jgi:GTP-binding protein YchF